MTDRFINYDKYRREVWRQRGRTLSGILDRWGVIIFLVAAYLYLLVLAYLALQKWGLT